MWWRRRRWICRHRRRQGGGGGSVDTDGGSGCDAVELAGVCGQDGGGGSVDRDCVKAVAVDLATQTVSVGVMQSSWLVMVKVAVVDLSTETASKHRRWICRHTRRQWV